MKVVLLYHPNSEHGRTVEEYARDFKKLKDKELELVSLETPAGSDTAKLYDVTRYPAVLAIREDGQLLRLWQDENLPLMDEVANYLQQF